MSGTITSDFGRILVHGEFTIREMPNLLAAMYNLTNQKGYKDIELDFTRCTSAFSSSMLPVAAYSQKYLIDKIDISLRLPDDRRMRNIFLNTNWANLIDFRQHPESTYRGYTQVPAARYTDASQQHQAVNRILEIVLSALSSFERSHLTAIEWAINEITDNVLNHSKSPVGGFVQVTNFNQRHQLEFSVCDPGVGIPASIRSNHSDLDSDQAALDRAIRQGVTRDKAVGQGNGLYGTWRICQLSEGRFEIHSGYSSLVSTTREGLHVRSERIPFNGSLVTARIGYGVPLDLKQALRFGEKTSESVDYVELHYDEDETGNIRFKIQDESNGFGSRAAGEPVRRKLSNLSRMNNDGRIIIDFSDVPVVSSSYADEVFGKLFVAMGPLAFSSKFDFRNVDPLTKDLIDGAIRQRTRQ